MKKKLILKIFLVFLLLGFLLFKKTFLSAKPVLAQSCQNVDGVCPQGCTYENDNDCFIGKFKKSYREIKEHFSSTHRILNFSGTTYISEFDDNNGVYAGHLGSFWALVSKWKTPVYSSHFALGEDRSAFWRDAFAHGLIFYNRDTGGSGSEIISSFDKGEWYPSKLVVSQDYTTPFVGRVTGTKMGIPGTLGFALKLKIENKGTGTLNLNLLSFSMLNSIAASYDSVFGLPRTDEDPNNINKKGTFQYNDLAQAVTFSHLAISPNAHLSIGFDNGNSLSGYQLADKGPNNINKDFVDNGRLDSTGNDNPNIAGSEAGLATELPAIQPNQSREIIVYFVFGSTPDLSRDNLNRVRNENVEQKADEFWNQRLARLMANIPQVQINDEELERLYLNSVMNLPMNLFDNQQTDITIKVYSYNLSEKGFVAEFPWEVASDSLIWTLSDKEGFKETLKDFLKVDVDRCHCRNPLTGESRCLGTPCSTCGLRYYAFDPSTIILATYDYLSVTEDWGFLSEQVTGKLKGVEKTQTVLQWLHDLAYLRETADGSLVDFGHDWNLYEFRDQGCKLRGLYTGQVPTPNGERYVIHKKMAEIYRKKGLNTEALEEERFAGLVKNSLNGLWNGGEKWFDTISLYQFENATSDAIIPRSAPLKNTFKGIWILHLLDYPGLLEAKEKEGLLSHLDEYIAPHGLYSVSKLEKANWCRRTDWHGPGVYIGEFGRLLGILFQNGRQEEAYSILNSVRYLSDVPYFGQTTLGDHEAFGEYDSNTAYLEGASFAQSFISGMFGVRPVTKGVQVAPVIPSELILRGPVSLSNLHIGNKTYAIRVQSNLTTASITSIGANSFQILMPNYQKTIVVNDSLPDLNNDGEVNFQDLTVLLQNWGVSPANPQADLNSDGIVNGMDFEKLRTLVH